MKKNIKTVAAMSKNFRVNEEFCEIFRIKFICRQECENTTFKDYVCFFIMNGAGVRYMKWQLLIRKYVGLKMELESSLDVNPQSMVTRRG